MEWTQFIIFFLGVFGLWIWNRTEGRADTLHMENMMRANRDLIDAIREDGKIFREQWAAESKYFHGRLCSIEERNSSRKPSDKGNDL